MKDIFFRLMICPRLYISVCKFQNYLKFFNKKEYKKTNFDVLCKNASPCVYNGIPFSDMPTNIAAFEFEEVGAVKTYEAMQKNTIVIKTPFEMACPPPTRPPTMAFSYQIHEINRDDKNITIGDHRATAITGSATC